MPQIEREVHATNMVRLPCISGLLLNGMPVDLIKLVRIRHSNVWPGSSNFGTFKAS